MSNRWTVEQWLEYQTTGKMPAKPEPTCECGQRRVVVDGVYECPNPVHDTPERVEKSVTTGRHHRKIVRRADVGVSFDSLTEERRWLYLREQPEVIHIDVHPIFELGSGIRYCADFLVHYRVLTKKQTTQCPICYRTAWQRVEDVKSKRALTTAFKDRKKLFDAVHPFAPLTVVQWIDKQWKVAT